MHNEEFGQEMQFAFNELSLSNKLLFLRGQGDFGNKMEKCWKASGFVFKGQQFHQPLGAKCIGVVHKWLHAIFDNFWPFPPIITSFIIKALLL